MDPPVPDKDALITSTQNLADEPILANEPLTPRYQGRDALNTSTQNLADEPTWADGPPSTRAEMTCLPLHKTWQINLLWPLDPLGIKHRFLNTATQNLVDEPSLANDPPGTRAEIPCIPVHKTWQMNLLWPMDPPPQYQSRDAMNNSTQHMADEPTLANGPPSTRAEMTCILL